MTVNSDSPPHTRGNQHTMPGYFVTALFVLPDSGWPAASDQGNSGGEACPEDNVLATAQWLALQKEQGELAIVDVRPDSAFDKKVIPGAIRLPWNTFTYNDKVLGIGGAFGGIEKAQEILGENGISRNDMVILYDSVENDGGATASYVFWVLDLLGHGKKKILERGINGWIEAGGRAASEPARRVTGVYQAPSDEISPRRRAGEDFIYARLGDPRYQIIDVRSREEYLGEKPDRGLDGHPLKPGHIPGAVNIDYRLNWTDTNTKHLKSCEELRKLYQAIDPEKAVIVYCQSGRRASFAYFVLKLMGFKDLILYDHSWNGWGNLQSSYPVEITEASR